MNYPIENNDDNIIEIKIFPNHPNLLNHESLAHTVKNFSENTLENPSIEINNSTTEIIIDPSLEQVKPIIITTIIKNIDTKNTNSKKNDFIQSLINHQKKLHLTLKHKHKFASIGVHDLSTISAPFKIVTIPKSHSFVPLMMTKKMTIHEILEEHPKKIEYAHLINNLQSFPIILNSNDDILSFPPIINNDHTTITKTTTNFFIDVTK